MGTNSGWLLRVWLMPLLLCGLGLLALREPISWWLRGNEIYDRDVMREWVREARVYSTLPELLRSYLALARQRADYVKRLAAHPEDTALRNDFRLLDDTLSVRQEEIAEHIKAVATPPTKMYSGQLPLFPIIYRFAVTFASPDLPAIVWDSQIPRHEGQYRELTLPEVEGATIDLQYRLHAYAQQQYKERQDAMRGLWATGGGFILTLGFFAWIALAQRRERVRQRTRLRAEQQLHQAERDRLNEELRRQEAERRQQNAERQTLELRSKLFANIGIMAGSYAHNIKNLLVRPNDLLRRCIEDRLADPDRTHMLEEVRITLGTVTERLQQILQTVRRDPSKTELIQIDLNDLTRDLSKSWSTLARDKWKVDVKLDISNEPLPIYGDLSHMVQVLENLLFNARDATFEMRNRLREQARSESTATASGQTRRDALIAAAGWQGIIHLRTRREGNDAVMEVQDNGIGMTDEVRSHCTDTHFSTKKNNALFHGLSAGMGLGLSFAVTILEQHRARLEYESRPLQGATFRIRFPLAQVIRS